MSGMVVKAPTARRVQPTARLGFGSSRSPTNNAIPAPSAARVAAIIPICGRVIVRFWAMDSSLQDWKAPFRRAHEIRSKRNATRLPSNRCCKSKRDVTSPARGVISGEPAVQKDWKAPLLGVDQLPTRYTS